jgi:hypothetical protein
MSEVDMGWCGIGGKLLRNWVDCLKALLAELNCLKWSTLLCGNDTSGSGASLRGTSILRLLKFLSYLGFTYALIMILLLLFLSIENKKRVSKKYETVDPRCRLLCMKFLTLGLVIMLR